MSLDTGCGQSSAEIEVSCVPAPSRQDAVPIRRPRVHRINGNNAVKNPALTKRARAILDREIEFIPHDSYAITDVQSNKPSIDLSVFNNPPGTPLYSGVPPHLARLCDKRVLKQEEEPLLFHRMNWCKYAASMLRSNLKANNPDEGLMDKIEELLDEAERIRNVITSANMRLVFSLAKKKKSMNKNVRLEDLISDGQVPLMRAVEIFECARGFRFSTYCYRAILNGFRSKYNRDSARLISGVTGKDDPNKDFWGSIPMRDSSHLSEEECKKLRATIAKLFGVLDSREREIIELRYALGGNDESSTLQEVGGKMGISKERVRQLEKRAKEKMREVAALSSVDDI